MAELGPELRRRRESAGLSLARLAVLAHFTKGYLSKVENGRVRANRSVVEAYDKALGAGGELTALVPGEPPRAGAGIAGLPARTRHFIGRETELAALSAVLSHSEDVRVCVVHGMAGAGKTALAIAAARQAAPGFPDGCLFFDLRGHTPGVPGLSPAEGAQQLLLLLGVPGDQLPPGVDGRANLVRDKLSGRRMLLVFDNVRSAAQISPLIPAEPACRVLVTSRARLPALDDAWHLHAGMLSRADALALFGSISGLPADEVAVEIVELCGLLPLAIRIAAARLVAGGWSARRLAGRLAAARLAALDDGERSVAAAFTVSYEELPAGQRRLFGLLALHPATPIDAVAATELAGAEADTLLDRLHDAHLITLDEDGVVHMHDLVRLFAVRYALPRISAVDRAAAVSRLVEYAAGMLVAADELVEPHRFRPEIDCPRPARLPFASAADALAWLRAWWPALAGIVELAAEHGLRRRCWQIAFVLRAIFFRDKLFQPWLRTHQCALKAAGPDAEGMILNSLGMAYIEMGELHEAAECHRRARERCTEAGDERGATDALSSLAWVRLYQGEPSATVRDLSVALEVYRAAGRRRNVAIALRGIALAETELGRFGAAVEHAEEARRLAGLPVEVLMAVNCLAWTRFRAGDLEAAERGYREAAELAVLAASDYERARALTGLGNVAHARGSAEAAAAHWSAADALGVPLEPRVLGEARARRG
ncbi:XRE family transcriptional regulator [Amycolatopsis pithecellobii]|uniref:Helix-turn-helix domain-containing protein n=1 Tax=Amycolatopsis pithecellobii TaxID=664692 RepID=A0A6N7Z7H7_9PSEU|nr:XRE family transcriptional regulator [Amycolatopsis pithecellobii]MTD57060.1 helix-turn-helix domain-containing protein [Amycolatopsis pithecellobii]